MGIWIFISILLIFPLFVGFYSLIATLLKILPANPKAQANTEGIDVWVVSNGAHSDLILPLRNEEMDWSKFIDLGSFKPGNASYVSFGWGDQGFYLETPSWGELKPKVAFKALFKLGKTTMQVVLHDSVAEDYKWKKSLKLNSEQYQELVAYIQKSFQYSPEGQIKRIEFAGLPAYEHLNYNFYEAEGKYHFFKTCNCWVNNALKLVEVRTATWAPFSRAIFHQLNKFIPDEPSDFNLQVAPRASSRARWRRLGL